MALRLNLGCGGFRMSVEAGDGWVNIDVDPSTPADLHVQVPPLPYDDGAVDEIYMGHMLEHLEPRNAHALLVECWRALKPGGQCGVLVPDTRAIMRRYLDGPATVVECPRGEFWNLLDLDEVCHLYLYSTVQKSRHLWSYDSDTLARAMTRAGFRDLRTINRFADPRIPVGGWFQCGWDGIKP